MNAGKERVAPGCLAPGASLWVVKTPLRKWQSPIPRACTNACTSETQKLLEVLAATLRSLSDEDRARLAELLEGENE